jgi:hypothetical protein
MAGVTRDLSLLQAILQFFSKVRSKIYIVPAVQVNTGILKGHSLRLGAKESISLSQITESKGCICLCVDNTVYLLKAKKKKKDIDHSNTDDESTEFPEKDGGKKLPKQRRRENYERNLFDLSTMEKVILHHSLQSEGRKEQIRMQCLFWRFVWIKIKGMIRFHEIILVLG